MSARRSVTRRVSPLMAASCSWLVHAFTTDGCIIPLCLVLCYCMHHHHHHLGWHAPKNYKNISYRRCQLHIYIYNIIIYMLVYNIIYMCSVYTPSPYMVCGPLTLYGVLPPHPTCNHHCNSRMCHLDQRHQWSSSSYVAII